MSILTQPHFLLMSHINWSAKLYFPICISELMNQGWAVFSTGHFTPCAGETGRSWSAGTNPASTIRIGHTWPVCWIGTYPTFLFSCSEGPPLAGTLRWYPAGTNFGRYHSTRGFPAISGQTATGGNTPRRAVAGNLPSHRRRRDHTRRCAVGMYPAFVFFLRSACHAAANLPMLPHRNARVTSQAQSPTIVTLVATYATSAC